MLLPRAKKFKKLNGFFVSDLSFLNNQDSVWAVSLIKIFSPDTVCSFCEDANVYIQKKPFDIKGAYSLSVTKERITLSYKDNEGMRNAIASLVQLITPNGITCAEIYDYPDNEFRSCMLDLARGYVKPDILKEHIIRLAYMKFNVVHLHLMDRQSYILESRVVPNPDNHRLYTAEQLKDIVSFCTHLGLEVIPEIEFPAHAVNLLKAMPELACDIIDRERAENRVRSAPKLRDYYINDQGISSWAVCIGKESTYKIFEAIIDEITEIFDSKYIHIGADEISFDELGAFPNWDNCHECQKITGKEKPDILAAYHYGVRRMNDIVKSKGKQMIKWVESRELYSLPDIPKDIILEYWITHNPENAQKEIDSFINQGFKLINAQYHYTYVDMQEYMTAKKINTWMPSRSAEQRAGILGGEMCAWELGNPEYCFYEYTLPVCMGLFCDRIWNSDTVEYDTNYINNLFRAVIGTNSLECEPLGIFDGIIPPRKKNILEFLNPKRINKDQLEDIISCLRGIDAEKIYGSIALSAYIRCLENIYRQI